MIKSTQKGLSWNFLDDFKLQLIAYLTRPVP